MKRTAIGRRIWLTAGITAGAAVIGAAAVAAVAPWPGPAADGAGDAIVLDGAITQVRDNDTEVTEDAVPAQVTGPAAVPAPQPRSVQRQAATDDRDDDRREVAPAAKKPSTDDRDDDDRDDNGRNGDDRDDDDRDEDDRDETAPPAAEPRSNDDDDTGSDDDDTGSDDDDTGSDDDDSDTDDSDSDDSDDTDNDD